MMIPYPSTSPAAQNVTYINDPVNTVAAAVGGTALGAVGIASMVALAQLMKSRGKRGDAKKAGDAEEREEAEDAKENTTVGIRLGEELSYICVNTSDLNDVVRLLARFQKQFRVLAPNTSPSL
jgi:hypothetical protein